MNDAPAPDPESAGHGSLMFQQVMDSFVTPELERRQAAAREPDEPVHRFLVLMPPDGEASVKLNREFQGVATVRATRDVAEGEEVETGDFDHVADFVPDDPDRGHPFIAGFAHGAGWSLVLRLGWQHGDAEPCLSLGREYAATANDALAAGRIGPALENAHSAAELFAKAVLLSAPPAINERVINSTRHKDIVPRFSKWTTLGNAPREFTSLLGRLQALRKSARYLNEPLTIGLGDTALLLGVLEEFEAFAEGEVAGDPLRTYFVIATRALRGGELVSLADMTIDPHDPRLRALKDTTD